MTKQDQQVSADHDDQPDEAATLFMQVAKGEDLNDSSDTDGANADEQLDQDGEAQQANKQEQEPGNDQDDDPWKDAPEHLRSQYQAIQQANQTLQQQYQSLHGRLAPTQRELDQLKRQLSEQQSKASKPAEQAEQPTAEEIAGMTDDELEAEWPEVAQALRKREQRLKSEWEKTLDEKLSPFQRYQEELQQQQQQQAIQSELSRLAEAHPDFQQVAVDPRFQQWVATQPPAVQSMYGSTLADDNIVLLNLYKGGNGRAPQAKPGPRKKDVSSYAEVPRKSGGNRMPANPDNIDPATLFMQIAKS